MKENNKILVNKSSEIIDLNEKYAGSAGFFVENSSEPCEIRLLNISSVSEIHFEISDNVNLKINFIIDDKNVKTKFTANVGENSILSVNCIDFSFENSNFVGIIDLNKPNASANWNTSCLNMKDYKKSFNISFNHNVPQTYSKLCNYGVCTGSSNLVFDGVSYIKKDCSKSTANQIAKIILYNEECRAKASPVLRIDNEDISASHGAAVGTLNEDHMFYLLSRGISEKEAKNLITFGYLKPVFAAFNEKEQEELTNLLAERI